MARRRFRTRTVFRRAKRSRRSGMSETTKNILGAIGYAVIGEPLLDQLASKVGLGLSDDLVKGVAGYFIRENTSGVFKGVGDAAMTVAAYKVGGKQIGNLLNKFGASSSTPTSSGSDQTMIG